MGYASKESSLRGAERMLKMTEPGRGILSIGETCVKLTIVVASEITVAGNSNSKPVLKVLH